MSGMPAERQRWNEMKMLLGS